MKKTIGKRVLAVLLAAMLLCGGTAPGASAVAAGTMNIGGATGISLAANTSGAGWDWDVGSNTLALDAGYTSKAPIRIDCGSGDTINLVYSGDVAVETPSGTAVECTGSLNVSGSGGTLEITSLGGSGTNFSFGIHVSKNVAINGGTLKITATYDGIRADNVTINDGTVDIIGDWLRCIYAFNNVTVSGGTLTAEGDCAIGASDSITISGGTVRFAGDTAVGSQSQGISAQNGITISGGTVDIVSSYYGISCGTYSGTHDSVTISGGAVNIVSANWSGIYTRHGSITISGGTVDITAADHGIDACNDAIISGGSGTINAIGGSDDYGHYGYYFYPRAVCSYSGNAVIGSGMQVKGWDGSGYTLTAVPGTADFATYLDDLIRTLVDAATGDALQNIQFAPAPDTTEYFTLWGKLTGWKKNPLNWILCILCFGWIWMAF